MINLKALNPVSGWCFLCIVIENKIDMYYSYIPPYTKGYINATSKKHITEAIIKHGYEEKDLVFPNYGDLNEYLINEYCRANKISDRNKKMSKENLAVYLRTMNLEMAEKYISDMENMFNKLSDKNKFLEMIEIFLEAEVLKTNHNIFYRLKNLKDKIKLPPSS